MSFDFVIEYCPLQQEYVVVENWETVGCIHEAQQFKQQAIDCGHTVNLIDEGYEGGSKEYCVHCAQGE